MPLIGNSLCGKFVFGQSYITCERMTWEWRLMGISGTLMLWNVFGNTPFINKVFIFNFCEFCNSQIINRSPGHVTLEFPFYIMYLKVLFKFVNFSAKRYLISHCWRSIQIRQLLYKFKYN